MTHFDPFIIFFEYFTVTNVYMRLMGPVNMKKKYKAEWALVTGAGQGIGDNMYMSYTNFSLHFTTIYSNITNLLYK